MTPPIPSKMHYRQRKQSALLHPAERLKSCRNTSTVTCKKLSPPTQNVQNIRKQLSSSIVVAIAVAIAAAITIPTSTASEIPSPGLLRQILSDLIAQDVFGVARRSSIQRCCSYCHRAKGKGTIMEIVSAATMPSGIGSQLQEVEAANHLIIFYTKY